MSEEYEFKLELGRISGEERFKQCSDYIMSGIKGEIDEILDGIDIVARQAANELCEKIKADSPVGDGKHKVHGKVRRKGKYRRGWVVDEKNRAHYKVRNKSQWMLTHLLENGHLKKGGTERVSGQPHINDNAQAIQKKFYEDCKEVIAKSLHIK